MGLQQIVFVECISTEGKLLGVSLVTWELLPDENGTKIIITDQLTALDGSDMAEKLIWLVQIRCRFGLFSNDYLVSTHRVNSKRKDQS